MSWKASAYVKELVVAPNGERVTRTEKLVLLVLADYHDERLNEAWPSVKTWAEDALVSEQTLKRIRSRLILKGVITSSPVQRENGSWSSNRYGFTALTTRTKSPGTPVQNEPVPVQQRTNTRTDVYEPPVQQRTQSLHSNLKEEPSGDDVRAREIRDMEEPPKGPASDVALWYRLHKPAKKNFA